MQMKYSILIVEDEVDLAESLKEFLRTNYQRVDLAPNGAEALKIIENHTYDLIISDIAMPIMSGHDFVRNLRLKGIHTPVIFLSGNGTKDIVQIAIKLGVIDFIDKPVTVDTLKNAIESTLQIEQHKRNIFDLKRDAQPDSDLIRNEQMAMGIKQVSLNKMKD